MSTIKLYAPGIKNIVSNEINLESDTIKVALMKEAFVFDVTHENYVNTQECDDEDYVNEGGAGQGVGGQVLSIGAIGSAGNVVTVDTDQEPKETVFTSNGTISAYHAVIYADLATPKLIGYIDFGEEKASVDGTWKITWDAAGLFKFTVNPE